MSCLLVVLSPAVQAGTYTLNSQDEGLVGAIDQVALAEGELLLDVARRHNLGYEELQLANADIDLLLPAVGQTVTLPGQHILPAVEQRGIVLNLAERRLYYFPDAAYGQDRKVFTYPVGIGRKEWPTPVGPTRIVGKVVKPTWYPPMSVRIEHAAKGDPLSSVVPPGPDNPLGEFALILDKPGYLIHGTNKPDGIGLPVSHGCVRMYPEDIAALFERVQKGTPVLIVDQAYKATVYQRRLYIEVHPIDIPKKSKEPLWAAIREALRDREDIRWGDVNWRKVQHAFERADGIPVAVTSPLVEKPHQQTVERYQTLEGLGSG